VTTNSGGDSLAILDGSKLSLQTADQKTDTIGGTVAVPISLSGLNNQEDVDIIMHYDPQLIYLGTYSVANVKLDIPGESWIGRSRLHIQGANSSGILANSYFNVFPDSNKKPIVTFDSLIMLSAIVPCNNVLIFSAASVITPASGCNADILTRFMRDSIMPQLSINPNPNGGDVFITSTRDIGEVNISIFDILGSKISESITSLKKNIPAKIMLHEPNGIYSIQVRSAMNTYNFRVVLNR
jgi:hypothetical protein